MKTITAEMENELNFKEWWSKHEGHGALAMVDTATFSLARQCSEYAWFASRAQAFKEAAEIARSFKPLSDKQERVARAIEAKARE